MSVQQARHRVGELRPSQILLTFGIGSVIDLPSLSVMVMGLNDWDPNYSVEINEPRLLAAAQKLVGEQLRRLLSPPLAPDTGFRSGPFDENALIGVPVASFPRWVVCPACRLLAPLNWFARASQALSLVWTGPDVETIPPRRTDQALLQLIEGAKATLTIVSVVAYKVPHVSASLAKAARRGAVVRLILEDAEASQGKVAFAALSSLGPEVAERCAVYIWPIEKRQKGPGGTHGSLHAKCAIAAGRQLLISSANLTEYAFSVNIELGVLVKGGALPAHAGTYWTSLIQSGVLSAVTG